MTVFDHDAADRARAGNPALTVFDTGQMLEPELEIARDLIPHPHPGAAPSSIRRKTGLVTFTNDESAPVLTVQAQPSVTDDDTTLVRIETPGGGRFKFALNDQEIWVGDADELAADSSATGQAFTVIGAWINDDPVVFGVIAGEHSSNGGDGGEYQPWATSVVANDSAEAETAGRNDMLVGIFDNEENADGLTFDEWLDARG